MKKYYILLTAILVLLLPACSQEILPNDSSSDGFRTERVRAILPETRVSIDETGVFSWSKGDDVAVHRSDSGYETATLTEDGCFNVHLLETEARDGFALYPARIADGSAATSDNMKVTLPSQYVISTEGMNHLSPLPMIAKNDPLSEDVHFVHLGGVLRLTLNNVPYEAASVRVNMGNRLTGSFSVSGTETDAPSIATDNADGEDITFTLAIPSSLPRNGYVLNIPVPTGSYPSLSVSIHDYQGNLLASGGDSETRSFERATGLRASLDLGIDIKSIPLTIKAIRTSIVTISNPLGKTIEFSRDNSNWTSISESSIVLPLEREECIYLRGNNASYSTGTNSNVSTEINCSNYCYIYGNIMSLVDSENFATATELNGNYTFSLLFHNNKNLFNHPSLPLLLPATKLAPYSYYSMFLGCTNLTVAPEIEATELAEYCCTKMFYGCTSLVTIQERLPALIMQPHCYESMFYECTSLTYAPQLPSTSLASACYQDLFGHCTKLAEAPVLPATKMAPNCYVNMFLSTAIVTPPALPATELANGCYQLMFQNCFKLLSSPELPATELQPSCYSSMLRGCSNLKTPPSSLPATTMVSSCYSGMFESCTSLTSMPDLPATSLATNCYYQMFMRCQSLETTISELPATVLFKSCYQEMFSGCTKITEAPSLPATELNDNCYDSMFNGCTSLTSAPDLPATQLVSYCYYQMFNGCSSLNHVKAMFTTKPESAYTYNWLNGVASTGTFIKNEAATWDVTGPNGIPSGWTVQTATN